MMAKIEHLGKPSNKRVDLNLDNITGKRKLNINIIHEK